MGDGLRDSAARLARAALLAVVFLGAGSPPAFAGDGPAPAADEAPNRVLQDLIEVFTSKNNGPFGEVHLPVVAYNPNAGMTYGILPVWLLTNRRHEIGQIIAPMFTYNRTFGPAFSGNYYYYPTDHAKLTALFQRSARSNRRVALAYEDLRLFDGRALVRAQLNSEADGATRFFGVGPATSRGDEQSERLLEDLAEFQLGAVLGRDWTAAGSWKWRRTQAQPGPFDAPRPLDPRVEPPTVYSLPRVTVSRDTRDLPYTPSDGSLAELFAEYSSRRTGSVSDYEHYGGQWRFYLPAARNMVLAMHAQAEWSGGGEVPFTALSALGGPRSVRGFPEGRFQDRGSAFVNLESRWSLYRVDLVRTRTELQAAPFVETGTVFPTVSRAQGRFLETVTGVAFRAVVKPTIVGRVEIGVGREGAAVFVGIDYPF